MSSTVELTSEQSQRLFVPEVLDTGDFEDCNKEEFIRSNDEICGLSTLKKPDDGSLCKYIYTSIKLTAYWMIRTALSSTFASGCSRSATRQDTGNNTCGFDYNLQGELQKGLYKDI